MILKHFLVRFVEPIMSLVIKPLTSM